MKATVIGITREVDGITKEDLHDEKVFSGKNAGICYMKDEYFNTSVSDPEKADARFTTVASTAHHSISDHAKVEVLFENCSKMLAIVLNSLQDYATSEKSGRYTVMTGNSTREKELYDKWRVIFKNRILELYPDIDDTILETKVRKILGDKTPIDCVINGEYIYECPYDGFKEEFQRMKNSEQLQSDKLAQENARYILSVFTKSTTMGYSTSLRQWNYIYDWCEKYINQYTLNDNSHIVKKGSTEEASYFELKLYEDLAELRDFIKENLYVAELRDTKNRCFEFVPQFAGNTNSPMVNYRINNGNGVSDDCLGITYSVSYPASFVHIAQAERHRTLKYFMLFSPNPDSYEFFIPRCIRGTSFEKEWLEDLKSVADLIPQATMVDIIETGHVSDFILKCEERLCGRAQVEIMEQTEKTARRFIEASAGASPVFNLFVDKLRGKNDCVNTKCKLIGVCKESCRWISTGDVFTRSI